MSRMNSLAAIFGVAVLMVVVAACGSGTESTSTRVEATTTGPTSTDADAEPGKSAADTAGPPQDQGPDALASSSAQSGEDPESSNAVQSHEEALAQDLALVAEARGWTFEEAVAAHKTADVVGRIAEQVAAERPQMFVGTVLARAPGGAPELYIKGPVDQFVRNLVADAEIEVEIVDGQPFSFDELEERKIRVHRALEAQGFRYVSTGFSITGGGQINAAVTTELGLPSDPDEILLGLPSELRASVELTVDDAPVVGDKYAGQ